MNTSKDVGRTNAGAATQPRTLKPVIKQLPSNQEVRGDRRLEQARCMGVANEATIDPNHRRIIEEKITE
jgi:hypothetical protein